MIRFIHTSDIHFGVENYGKIDLQTGIHSRLLDFAKAVHYMIDVAIEEQVDFFLFAGDAYKVHNPTQTQQKMLLEAFFRLQKANIPVVIIVGNHDHPVSFGKIHALDVFAQFPLEGFHVIAKPRMIKLETKSGPVQIVGIPWPTRSNLSLQAAHKDTHSIATLVGSAVSRIVAELAALLDTNIPAVLSGHLTVSNGIFSGSERTAIIGTDPIFLPASLTLPQFDYVALGHLHRYQQLSDTKPPIVYSGSPERIDFGERNDTKGFCLVSIERNHPHHEFIKTPTRNFVQLDIILTNDTPYTDQIVSYLEKTNIRDAVIKIVYTLPEIMLHKIDMQIIYRAAAKAMYIAGIIPRYTNQIRTTRMTLDQQQQSISTIIESYIESKPEYRAIKSELLEKIAQLSQEVQVQPTED
jgi:DNA repair protein SbcD/Mre11